MSHNMFQFIGNLTRDTELHNSQGGSNRAIFDVAVNRTWGKGADKQERTDFFRIKSFGATADSAARYLGKGSKVFVQGRIENTRFEKDGKTEFGTDFIAEKIDYLDTKAPEGQPQG
ncbi:single-stranded DNA-binding protein [Vibrio cholerae]